MHKQRKIIFIAAAAGFIATFLPWFTVSAGAMGYSISNSRNGFHGAGIIYFIVLAAVAVISFIGNPKETLQKNTRLGTITAGAVAIICLLVAYNQAKDDVRMGLGFVDLGMGIGLFLAIVCCLAIVIVPFVIKNPGENFNNDVALLKEGVRSVQGSFTSAAPHMKPDVKMAELEKLIKWRSEGIISQQEYEELKSKII